MNAIYTLLGFVAMALLFVLFAGLITPRWSAWAYKPLKKSPESLSRKYITATAIPALILTGAGINATEPPELKAERAAREQATLVQQQKIEADKKAAELAAKKKAEANAKAKQEAEAAAAAEKAKADEAVKAASVTQTPAQTYSAPVPQSSTPTAPSAPPSTTYVHAGAYCAPAGATGTFTSGNPAVCALDSKGIRYRWKSP
jgi:cell division protein FtsN